MPLHKPHGKKSQVYQVQPGNIFEVIHEHSELLGPDAKHEALIDTYLRGPKSRVHSSNPKPFFGSWFKILLTNMTIIENDFLIFLRKTTRILNNFRKGPLHETPNQAQDVEFRA